VSVGTMVVVKLDGPALLCKTDEVGELCLSSNFTGTGYWGLPGVSSASFKVCTHITPTHPPLRLSQHLLLNGTSREESLANMRLNGRPHSPVCEKFCQNWSQWLVSAQCN